MEKNKYQKEGNSYITKCPHYGNGTMVGSLACSQCYAFIRDKEEGSEGGFVECDSNKGIENPEEETKIAHIIPNQIKNGEQKTPRK